MGPRLLRHKHFCVHTAAGSLPVLSHPMQQAKSDEKDIPLQLYEKNVKERLLSFPPCCAQTEQ